MTTRLSLAVAGIVVVLSALGIEAQESEGPPDARALLEQSIAAMGGQVPQTSRIVGSVEIVAGGEARRGTITCLTRGRGETREIVEAGGATEDVTYAFGHASTADGAAPKRLSLNLALSSDSLCFPLAVLSRALANPETQFELLGDETTEHRVLHHVRLSNVSDGGRASLGSSSSRDIWIDSETFLPSQVKLDRRAAQGSEPAIAHGCALLRLPADRFMARPTLRGEGLQRNALDVDQSHDCRDGSPSERRCVPS